MPNRTDLCANCGHSWEWHEPTHYPDTTEPEGDTNCVFFGPFARFCDCAAFVEGAK